MTALNALWANVIASAPAGYTWGEDDDGMRDAPADDLLAWVDDVEARLGFGVADFRAAVLTFIAYRDNGAGLDDATYAGSLAEAFDMVADDAEAAQWIVARIEICLDLASAVYARDPSGSNRDALDAWRGAVAFVGGDA